MALLTKQVGIFEDIKTLCTNYKKDSITRKNVEYLEKRLKNLEELWVLVKVKSADGTYVTLRGLLDQGSQINLITENAAQLLRLPRKKLDAAVTGIGSTSRTCKGLLHLECQSIHSSYKFNVQALILPNLTSKLPSCSFQSAGWTHLQNLKLADPNYNVSSSIDLLLGADVYADIVLDGVLKGDQQSPIAQQTHLGWILCGKLKTFNCHFTLFDTTNLTKYWESEDIAPSMEDIQRSDQCELYYQETTKRDSDGKYIVKMPMNHNYDKDLGSSKSAAIAQFLQQEKRLCKNEKLSTMYKNFIREYLELQHMKPAGQITSNQLECYLPHHGVLREQSTTTKLRVVFNAAQKTSSGKKEWLRLKDQLDELKTITINRWIGTIHNKIELFAFCDASEKAYSCVIYTRALNETGEPKLSLLAAKTRVAPLANKLSLPRLELSGALLLSQLVCKIIESLTEHTITTWAWCDSKVVLAWLQGATSKWEKYVENRVIKIKQVVPASNWFYIESKNNPADCATRGLYPKQLVNFHLWWNGPATMRTFPDKPKEQHSCLLTTTMEQKSTAPTLSQPENIIINLINNYSNLNWVTRIIAWIVRFRTNSLSKAKQVKKFDAGRQKQHNDLTLTANELNCATNIITRNVQRLEFSSEYDLLLKNEHVSTKSKICKLSPYIDKEGILRVGGRLNKTNLPPGMKNPAILPRKHRLTELLISQAHIATLHGGARLTLAFIRQHYWIIGGNRAVKTQLRQCIRCHRFKPTENYQFMADLPPQRVTPWQLTENMFHQFWKHWSSDYLATLQARSKWLKPTPNIKPDDVVLIKENNLPPGKWALGRIIEVHPGSDGYVRVATIKTQGGTLKRPITKLSPLPIETRH
ncbi:hypothetical protein HF086_005202 [Spodoptera exigua]|uniref:Uncharacterized protein n=1 Tax=Spodoptera exigua TaxID=7107 RepID=A0A922MZ90_SPOEX|nr:hypothetical protein HF086_005202 [Spodoptera exigua]